MQVFLFEFVSGGGFVNDPAPGSLLREGGAMMGALADDLVAAGVEVVALRDARLSQRHPRGVCTHAVRTPEEFSAGFTRLTAFADWTIVIAPELSGHLLRLCRHVMASGGRLFGPEPAVVELASDKQRTADHLSAAGIPVPEGRSLSATDRLPFDFPYPGVLKPRFGAGSQGVRLVESSRETIRNSSELSWRLERFQPGIAASVAILCGPGRRVPLLACRQHVSSDGRFTYQGGSLPLPEELASRAAELAERAVAALPNPTGYIGVDLVLGNDPHGQKDVVIEINPRLTTSYVGLRCAAEVNLAAAMLAVRQGGEVELSFRSEPVQFDPDGGVSFLPEHSA